MKRLILPVLAIFIMAGCSDDVSFNTPSIQGMVGGHLFHSMDPVGQTNGNGTLTIKGEDGSQSIALTISSANIGQEYEFGGDSENVATFQTSDGVLYSTDTAGVGTLKVKGNENNQISGTFYFYATPNGGEGDTLNISQGAFFGVPVGGAGGDVGVPGDVDADCVQAILNATQAGEEWQDAQENGSAEEIQEACENYKAAIENVIENCDDAADWEEILDNLDCDDAN